MQTLVLTGISEVEIIVNVAGDVVFLFVLSPMCICLWIIPNKNSKQHNHSNLPDKADSRQANTQIGVLLLAEKAVPHSDDSLLKMFQSLLSQVLTSL